MRKIALLFALMASLGGTAWAQARVETYDVVARGYGSGETEAVQDAIYNAIRQISGERVASSTKLKTISTEITHRKSDKTSTETSAQRSDVEQLDYEVSAETRGLVSSYSVEDVGKEAATGRTMVSIRARVPLYIPDPQSKRLKLAVLPVTLGASAANAAEAAGFAASVSATLEAALVSTQRFAILDRSKAKDRTDELSRLESQDVPLSETIRIGQSLVAQYLSVTDLTAFQSVPAQRTTSTGRVVDYLTVQYQIELRVIDVDTGQIRFAHTLSGQQSIFPPNGMADVARNAGGELADLITSAIYPMVVVALQPNSVTLSPGGVMVKPRQRYSITAAGAFVETAGSGKSAVANAMEVAVVEITSASPEAAQARLISGSLPLQAPPNSLIARRLPRTQADVIADFNRTIDAVRNGDGASESSSSAW